MPHKNSSEKDILLFYFNTTIKKNIHYHSIVASYPHHRKINLHKIKISNH